MRKRIVIGVLAMIGVGVLVYVLSQPKRGTIKWHKREYLALSQGPLTMRAQNLWYRIRGKDERYDYGFDDRQETHQKALIRLGYLERREFVFTNRSVDDVPDEAMRLFRTHPKRRRFQEAFLHVDTRTNVMIIVCTRDDMPMVAEIMGKADVP